LIFHHVTKAPENSEDSDILNLFRKDDENDIESGESPWRSLWIANFIQFLCGIQFAIYFTSMWPYLSGMDHDVALSFVGYITACFSLGMSISSPLFGFWSQKSRSTKYPTCCGLILTAIGNLLYALLPTINHQVKWLMLVARVFVGFGTGNISVLRAYCATASTNKDRKKAMALSIASFVFGQSLGPAIQVGYLASNFSLFSPIKENGFSIGTVRFNMYTIPAYFMIILSICSIVLLTVFFEERYAGIMQRDETKDPYAVLPKFDKIAAIVMIYMWYIQQSTITHTEVIASPLTISVFNWNDSKAILYNGLIQSASCIVSVVNYFLIAYTRVGELGKRRMMICAVAMFIIHFLINLPWPFYPHSLKFIVRDPETNEEDTAYSGGCYEKYKWCESNSAIPLPLYIFSAVCIFGIAFPYFAAPTGTLYSQLLGPRNQGTMQGVFDLFGSIARCIGPLITTNLFEHWGYIWPNMIQLIQFVIGFILLIIFYRRLIPLQIVPKTGRATKYKHGTFYHM
uniref:MFS domain-containing protein n=1 Tax=Syphacia muris TaxID=451379 RepID=A0A0N5AKZ4_9BILA